MNDVVQARYHGLGNPCGREAVAPSVRAALLLALRLLLFLAVRGSQVEQKRVMLIVLLCFLPPRLRLSLVVQQQVRVVVAATVRHHHRPDGAGVDVLDLEKTLHDVYVLGLDILGDIKNKQTRMKLETGVFGGEGFSQKKKNFHQFRQVDLESFVEPEHRAGRHVADPVQVPRDQVRLVKPAAKHVVRFVPDPRQQRVIFWNKSLEDQQ